MSSAKPIYLLPTTGPHSLKLLDLLAWAMVSRGSDTAWLMRHISMEYIVQINDIDNIQHQHRAECLG